MSDDLRKRARLVTERVARELKAVGLDLNVVEFGVVPEDAHNFFSMTDIIESFARQEVRLALREKESLTS